MNDRDRKRIVQAAIVNGRAERRRQGIPQRIEDPRMTAVLVALLRSDR